MSRLRITFLLLCPLAACGGKSDPPPASTGFTCPIATAVAAPTFTVHVLPALRLSCGSSTSTCHSTQAPGGGTELPAGHFSLEAGRTAAAVLADLVGVDPTNAPMGLGWKRVAAGDVAHSWIVEKITKDAPGGSAGTYGARMPYGAPNVCAPTVQAIQAWITQGALL